MGVSAKTKQSSTSTYTPTPEASGLYTDVIDQARAAQSPYNPATAKTVAGFTDAQNQAFGNIAGNQGAWQPAMGEAGSLISGAGQGISAADISKFYNPYQSDVINTTLQQIQEQDAMARRSYTANEAAQGGLGGSGYHIGRAQLQGEQAEARNQTIANLMSQGYSQALAAAQADKQRALSAGQGMANIGQLTSQLGYTDANALLASGNQQQAQQQNVNDTASQNALNEQLFPMQQAQWLASIASGVGPLTGGTTQSSGSSTQSQGKGVGSAIGGALTLASMASDSRVKDNARPIGTTHDGQTIYSYNYKGDPRTQIGLMAQEVEQHHPEAVNEGPGGVKMVNYDRALEDASFAGGGLAMPQGLMPWADLKPAQVRWPDAPDVRAPAQQQDQFDPQAALDMGKKAGAGLSNIGNMLGFGGSQMPSPSSPAGGALAASGLQGYGGSGGGIGSLFSSLGGMFGFQDGGMVPTPEEMNALEMVESGGRDIVNPKSGAFGPRQLMPATARDPGFGVRPLDPAGGIPEQRRFSDDYYTAMLNRYGGDRDAARIAYNGGPRRADAWIKAGRDDSVIPRESADYYKKISNRLTPSQHMAGSSLRAVAAGEDRPTRSGTDGGGTSALVQKGFSGARADGESYSGKADKATGGLLKRVFGIDFNPLGLTENERRALMVAGLSMLSSGDVGRGGLMGMQYLSGAEAGDREERRTQATLAHQMAQDKRAVEAAALAGRREDRMAKTAEEELAWKKGEPDRRAAEPTGDMKEYEAAKKEGYTGSFVEFQLAQKRASSAAGAGLPAEVGARIGLGRVFINMVPDIEKRIDGIGTKGRADLALGRGEAAAIWRDIETGREALVRGLTGAGMSQTEAQNAADRYQISPTDKADTMKTKVRNLKRDLEAVEAGAIEGKSGAMSKDFDKPTSVKTETIPGIPVEAPKISPRPAGTDDDLRRWAKEAVERGAPPAVVQQRMEAWGVR